MVWQSIKCDIFFYNIKCDTYVADIICCKYIDHFLVTKDNISKNHLIVWLVSTYGTYGGSCKKNITIFPKVNKRWTIGMEWEVWEATFLFSFLRKDRLQSGRGE